ADARVDDLELNLLTGRSLPARRSGIAHELGSQGQRAALGHGIDGVEDEVDEGLADLTLDASDRRELGGQFHADFDDDPALLGHVAPAGPSQGDDLLDELV